MEHRWTLTLAMAVTGLVLAVAPGGASAAPEDEPAFTVSDETVAIRVQPDTADARFWSRTTYDYSLRMFIHNTSDGPLEISVLLNSGDGTSFDLGQPVAFDAGEAKYVLARADDVETPLRGAATIEVTDGTTVAVVDTEVDVMPNGTHHWWAIGAAFTVAIVLVGVLACVHRSKPSELAVGTTWKFSESWATNITVVGATLTTLLASAGLLQALAPNLSDGRIVALNLMFLALALFAPIVYLVFAKRESAAVDGVTQYVVKGRKAGFLVAALVTSAAVLGQLAVLALVVAEFDTTPSTKLGVWVLLGLGVLAVVLYVIASTAAVMLPVGPAQPTGAATMSALL